MVVDSIKISVESALANRIIRIVGDIDTTTAPELDFTLSSLRNEEALVYFIDLKSVGYISSMGLRVFLSHLKKVRACGGQLVLTGSNQLISDVFRMSGFTSFFVMRDSLDAALAELA